MMTEQAPPTMTVPAAAALLGIGQSTLYRAIERGEIDAIRIGRCVRIPRVIVDRLIADGNTKAAS